MKTIKMPSVIMLLIGATFTTMAQNSTTSKKTSITFVRGLWADGSCLNQVIISL